MTATVTRPSASTPTPLKAWKDTGSVSSVWKPRSASAGAPETRAVPRTIRQAASRNADNTGCADLSGNPKNGAFMEWVDAGPWGGMSLLTSVSSMCQE